VDKTGIQEEGIVDFFNPPEEDEEMPDAGVHNNIADGKPQDVQSSYIRSESKTPAPKRKVSAGNPHTPAMDEMRSAPPSSGKRKAAENAMEKLHNEVMPDLMQWEKEKNRKRFPADNPPPADDGEKRRKTDKRKSEEKENILEGVQKKVKKTPSSETVTHISDTGSKITLLVTGADPSFLDGSVVKVGVYNATDIRNY
jgi:hypothetical protein